MAAPYDPQEPLDIQALRFLILRNCWTVISRVTF